MWWGTPASKPANRSADGALTGASTLSRLFMDQYLVRAGAVLTHAPARLVSTGATCAGHLSLVSLRPLSRRAGGALRQPHRQPGHGKVLGQERPDLGPVPDRLPAAAPRPVRRGHQ